MIPPAIEARICDMIRSTTDYYPAASTDADGHRHVRTSWEDGWNAAISTCSQRYWTMCGWWKALKPDARHALETLLESPSLVFVLEDDGAVVVTYTVNDVFAPSADSEDLPPHAWPLCADLWRAFGDAGVLAWIAHARQSVPWEPWQTPAYHRAIRWLSAHQEPQMDR